MSEYNDHDRRFGTGGSNPRLEPKVERPEDRSPVERGESWNDRPVLTSISQGDMDAVQHSTVRWQAIFAGLFVSLMTHMTLMSAGLALGGSSLVGVISGQDSAQALGIGAGIWSIAAIVISLFVGAFAASRVSGLITNRIGRTQGVVIAALFFGVMLSQLGSAIGVLGKGVGSTVGALGTAAGDLAKNPQVQDLADDVIGDLNLRSSPEAVVSGVTRRLVRGDGDSAANYLAREAGISREEANTRLQTVQTEIQAKASEAGTTAAHAIKMGGLIVFGALVLGMLSGIMGGGIGAGVNLRRPLSRADRTGIRDQRAA